MKLFYASGACSLSPHIVAHEAGIELSLQKVDLKTKTMATEGDYLTVNPKGSVPALQLDDGQVLTEGPVIVQYLADLKPEKRLAPAAGTLARYRLQEWLGYINSELHKTYSPLFRPDTPAETRAERQAYLSKRYAIVESRLAGQAYLLGDSFTVADAYLFTVTNWAGTVKFDLAPFPNLRAFQERIAARPAVKAAMRAEGLIK
ncbi:MAG TPA: glutathione transferase GstA [Steroidobacteraceae bacterium]|nr:glutathione transferase GstA [Steroidobacteraceae bacterium]